MADCRKGKMAEKITRVVKKLVYAIDDVRKGKFVPRREDDELTLALENPEHWGQCRGYEPETTWKQGFPADIASYRSRSRNKQKGLDRLSELERQLKRQQEQLDSITQQRASQLQLEHLVVDASPSQRKSSVSSTQLDVSAFEPPAAHYPEDDITKKTNCELHMAMKNLSFQVAVGYALPNQPGSTYHVGQILAGYAHVGVVKVLPRYQSLELDIPRGDSEKTLGEVELGIILWKKKYIMFPDSTPRPPTPPSRNSPPQSPPAFLDDWVPTASPSSAPSRQLTDSPTSNLAKRKLFTSTGTMLRKDRSPVKKRLNIPKKVKTPEKLPAEKSKEELEESSRVYVKSFFAQKKQEKQDPVKELLKNIPRETLEHTIDNLYIPPVRPLSDYERGIDKQHSS